jgi:superfamily II DNA or RNA helicase
VKIKIAKDLSSCSIPDEILTIIKDDLTFYNPIWVENHKMGRWNKGIPRWIYMYKEKGKRIGLPTAYLEELSRILKKNEIPFKVYDQREKNPVEFEFHGTLKDFQEKAVGDLLAHDWGTLVAPTGSGKTVMGIYMIAHRKERTLILVHTKDLAFQWIDRIESFMKIDPKEVGLIGAGKKKKGERITVALVQSVFRNPGMFQPDEFGHVIVDECHRSPSRTFSEAITLFKSYYSLGLTATPFRRDKLDKLIFFHLGAIRHQIQKKTLERSGDIMKARFIMRETEFEPTHDPIGEYSKMLSELTRDRERNELICRDIAKHSNADDITLILSDRKAHCELLREGLLDRGITAQVLTGATPPKKRKEIIKNIGTRGYNYICATGQLIGEGFDCKELNVLYITTPIRFTGRIIQYIGRILRPAKGKESAIVFDYADWYVDVLARAAKHRIKIYGKGNVIHE